MKQAEIRAGSRIPAYCAATLLYWFSLYAYGPMLPVYIRQLGASYRMTGLIIGSYGFVQMLLRVPLGIASDRLRRRKPFVLLGLLCALLASAGLLVFRTPGGLLAMRALSGAAAAAWVSFTVLFASYYPEGESPRAVGIMNALCLAGQVASMLAGGLLGQRFGIAGAFAASVGAAGLALLLGLTLRENPPAGKPMRVRDMLAVARSQNFLVVSALAVLGQFMLCATVAGFTPVVAKNLGAGSFQLGLLTALTVLPGVAASLLCGAASRRFGERAVVAFGFLLTAAACASVPFVHSLPVLFVTQIIGGFGVNGTITLLMGLCIRGVESARRSTAMGLFQALYGIGMTLGPVVVGAVIDRGGLSLGFFIVSAVGVCAAALAFRLRGGGRRRQFE